MSPLKVLQSSPGLLFGFTDCNHMNGRADDDIMRAGVAVYGTTLLECHGYTVPSELICW